MRKSIGLLLLLTVFTLPVLTATATAAGKPDLSADKIYYDYQTGLFHLNGNIRLRVKDLLITADKASIDLVRNLAWVSGNISVNQDEGLLIGERAEVYGKQRTVRIFGNVRMERHGIILVSPEMEFNWKMKTFTATRGVSMVSNALEAKSDAATYNTRAGQIILTSNVVAKAGNQQIQAQRLELFPASGEVVAYGDVFITEAGREQRTGERAVYLADRNCFVFQ